MAQHYARRKFLKHITTAMGSLLGTLLLPTACRSGSSEQEQAETERKSNPCPDLTEIAATDLERRKKFGYVDNSPISESQCSNCNLWLPPTSERPCGGCTLFAGPVAAEGYCTYWAPQSG